MYHPIRAEIDTLYFRRIILHIEGTVSKSEKLHAGFVEKKTGKVLYPETQTYHNGRFSLTINVLSADQEHPISSGEYDLEFQDEEGNRFGAGAGFDVENPKNLQQLTFGNPNTKYFRVQTKFDSEDHRFYLDVTYRIHRPEKWNIIKKKIKKKISILKSRSFRFYVMSLFHLVRRKGNKILFCSASRAEIGGNEKFVRDRMVERGLDQKFKFRYDFVKSISTHRGFRKLLRLGYYLGTSDIVILDDYYPTIYLVDFPPDVKVIQAWHACGAFKTVGLERMGKKGAPALDTRIHKNYTHIPVSSMHSALHNAEAFGLDLKKFYPIGVPRTDVFFDPEYRKTIEEKMYEVFPAAKTAGKVYLYAPTFRGINARDASFPFDKINLKKWGSFCRETNSILIIKMHPFVRKRVEIPEEYADCILDAAEFREVNDLLFIVDVLITDYSSIIYEFSLLHRPMYFYIFDRRSYESSRDFYEPFEQIIPGKAIENFDELLQTLRRDDFDYSNLDAFVKKNFTYTDGKSTDRFIDTFILK